jgi:hypothetical protein
MMKLIKDNESNVVPWLFEDSTTVTMQNDQIDVGDPEYLEFIIGDMSNQDSTLVLDVTAPDDGFVGCKFTYIDGVWAISDAWAEPEEEEAEA